MPENKECKHNWMWNGGDILCTKCKIHIKDMPEEEVRRLNILTDPDYYYGKRK